MFRLHFLEPIERLLAYGFVLATLYFLTTLSAFAQDVGGVDLSWIYDSLAPLVAAVIMAFAGVLIVKIQNWTGLKIEAEHRAALDMALQKAVDYALSTIGDKTRGAMVIDTGNPLVITAATYARAAVPGALKQFGISEDRLRQMILARLAPAEAGMEQPVT